MNATAPAAFFHKPTTEEIATQAFLAWEKEGCQPNREQHYWLQAEALLQQRYTDRAIAAASLAAQPWPRTGTTTQAAAPKAAAASNRITPTADRSPAPKASVPAQPAAPQPANRSRAKATR